MLSIHSTDIDSLRICDSGVISSGNIKLQGIIATQKHNCDSNLLPIRTLFSVMSNPLWKILSTGAEEAGGGGENIFSTGALCKCFIQGILCNFHPWGRRMLKKSSCRIQ